MPWVHDSISIALIVFGISAAVILLCGIKITRLADALGKRTGMGSALFGAVLLGGTTSLPGIITSVSTAWQGYPALSASNAVGGIAAQTVFLIFADMFYRKANLEHAAASLENMVQCGLLIALLAIAMMIATGPEWVIFGTHVGTIILLLGYGFGLKLIADCKEQPFWHPSKTKDTHPEREIPAPQTRLSLLWSRFICYAFIIAVAGFSVGESGVALANQTGLKETTVGALLTAIATSLPELVTVIAAVRIGALTLAVGDIIGGNSFDVLFLAFSDIAFREGSIYHAMGENSLYLISTNLLMSTILLLGLLRRKRSGIGNIGFEGIMILSVYLISVATITR